jgi:hypothetical protein
MSSTKTIRIGNGAGFWGDQLDAPQLLAEDGGLDYLTLEYLAELTLSILAHQRRRDSDAGYVSDISTVVQSLTQQLTAQPGLKIVTNAGGMNPISCARAVSEVLCDSNLKHVRVAAVSGDDLLPQLDELISAGETFSHFEDNRSISEIRETITSANVYLGADGIVSALQDGARIVITGRIADASLVVGPALYEFGWNSSDWDLLAAATTAGHLIECGAQVTGGMYSGWSSASDFKLDRVGYPIAELSSDGTCVITKPDETDGRVDVATVSEQLVYEIGDPTKYFTPDVVADFSHVELQQVGLDRVGVSNCHGTEKPASYKVSMSYEDGFFGSNSLVVAGPNAIQRAAACESAIRSRLSRIDSIPAALEFEHLGCGHVVPGVHDGPQDPPEIVLRGAAHDPVRDVIDRFLREFSPLVTSGPPGVTGYTGARPRSTPVLGYWPSSIQRERVKSNSVVKSAQEWCDV